jgi:hypothetical protein
MASLNREEASDLANLLIGYCAQKPLQFRHSYNRAWIDVPSNEPIEMTQLDRYRIKPEGPKLRPWKPREVPIGALLREKNMLLGGPSHPMLIIGVDSEGVLHGPKHHWTFADIFSDGEWAWPREARPTVWLPCGVEET